LGNLPCLGQPQPPSDYPTTPRGRARGMLFSAPPPTRGSHRTRRITGPSPSHDHQRRALARRGGRAARPSPHDGAAAIECGRRVGTTHGV